MNGNAGTRLGGYFLIVFSFKKENNFAVDREKLRIIQTPQCFEFALLNKAYENIQAENFTDDAGVFEFSGNKIHLVEGEKSNIKITEPADLLITSSLEKELFRP